MNYKKGYKKMDKYDLPTLRIILDYPNEKYPMGLSPSEIISESQTNKYKQKYFLKDRRLQEVSYNLKKFKDCFDKKRDGKKTRYVAKKSMYQIFARHFIEKHWTKELMETVYHKHSLTDEECRYLLNNLEEHYSSDFQKGLEDDNFQLCDLLFEGLPKEDLHLIVEILRSSPSALEFVICPERSGLKTDIKVPSTSITTILHHKFMMDLLTENIILSNFTYDEYITSINIDYRRNEPQTSEDLEINIELKKSKGYISNLHEEIQLGKIGDEKRFQKNREIKSS